MAFDEGYLEYIIITAVSTVAFYLSIIAFAPKFCEIFLKKRYDSLSIQDKDTVSNSVVCGLNGVLSFLAACYIFSKYDFSADIFGTDNYAVKVLACVEAGYFLADGIHLMKTPDTPGRLTFFAHHTVCLMAYYVVVVHKFFAFHMTLRTINELSTLFFNGRIILAAMDMKEKRLYFVNGLLFLATFFVGRILLMPIIYFTLFSSIFTPTYLGMNHILRVSIFIPNIFVDILNVYWFTFIVKGFRKYLAKMRDRSSMKKN